MFTNAPMFTSHVTDKVNTITGSEGKALDAIMPMNQDISFRGMYVVA
jgi:hypothetical protein